MTSAIIVSPRRLSLIVFDWVIFDTGVDKGESQSFNIIRLMFGFFDLDLLIKVYLLDTPQLGLFTTLTRRYSAIVISLLFISFVITIDTSYKKT